MQHSELGQLRFFHTHFEIMNDFYHWVANTIAELGGNPGQYLRGVEEECALTFVESGMVACQGVFGNYFQEGNLDLTRVFLIAHTNYEWLH